MAEIAFSLETVAADGLALRYRAGGSGKPLVCLGDAGRFRLSRTHELLAASHRVLLFEEPGRASRAEAAALLNRAVAALSLDRYDVMGHGTGAGLALAMALAERERLDAVVLTAPVAIPQAAEEGRSDEFEAALAELRVPVLALFGTADRVTPTSAARRYRTVLPNCHVVMVYDAGHALEDERPEAAAAVIADFLERRESFIVSKESGLIHP